MRKPKERQAGGAPQLLTPAEAALRLRFSRSRLYALAAAGEIPSIKFGRAVRFEERDVEAYVQAHRRGQTPAA